MDTPDKETATSVIQLNKNGIGFSRTGINGQYDNALSLIQILDDVKRCNGNTTTEDGLEVVGRAVTDILEEVFGRDNAKIIAEFYNGRYFEMCREVMPFVTGVVIPEIRKIAQENKKTIAAGYNRKQRSMFGRK